MDTIVRQKEPVKKIESYNKSWHGNGHITFWRDQSDFEANEKEHYRLAHL